MEKRNLSEAASRVPSLSPRQKQVLRLVAEGLTNKEMAEKLKITAYTVMKHREWMVDRLSPDRSLNVAEQVRVAVRAKLVTP